MIGILLDNAVKYSKEQTFRYRFLILHLCEKAGCVYRNGMSGKQRHGLEKICRKNWEVNH